MGSPGGTKPQVLPRQWALLVVPSPRWYQPVLSLGIPGGTELCASPGGTEPQHAFWPWGTCGQWVPSLGSLWVASSQWVALPGLRVPTADVPTGGCHRAQPSLCPSQRCCPQALLSSVGRGPSPFLLPASSILGLSQLGAAQGLGGAGRPGQGAVLGAALPHGESCALSPLGWGRQAGARQGWGHQCCLAPLGSGDLQMGGVETHHPWVPWEGGGVACPSAGSGQVPGPWQPSALPGLVLASVTW